MDKMIGLIFANYETPGLGSLTEERTIASLPYGGRYRLIDFPLSNMVNSGISTVGLITPYKYRSIIDHIGAGKEWSLDRKNGGLFILPGSVFGVSNINTRFLLRDLKRNAVYLKRASAEYVVVTAANVVCSMDYDALLDHHIASGAGMTLACCTARRASPDVTKMNLEGTHVKSLSSGVQPGDNAFLGCFVVGRDLLLNITNWYSTVDFMDLLEAIQADYEKLDLRAYHFDGYARSIYRLQDYYDYSRELLHPAVQEELFSKSNPIMTKIQDSVPSKYLKDAVVRNSLIPTGCVIEGTVENSILFRGVKVGKDAVVRNSILMQSCVLEDGAHVENAIIDRNNIIRANNTIKGSLEEPFIMIKKNK